MSTEVLTKTPHNTYKYYTFLSACYIAILYATLVLENRLVSVGPFLLSSGTLVLPLSYAINDVVTEIYGYQMARRLIWTSIFALILFTILISIILLLPSKDASNIAYHNVLGTIPRNVFAYSVATIAGSFINIYFISKWKILLHGRYFWARSLACTIIGEAFFIIIMGSIAFYKVFPFHVIVAILFDSYLTKIVYNLITIIPTALLVVWLKRAEGIDTYDVGVNFNPFSLET